MLYDPEDSEPAGNTCFHCILKQPILNMIHLLVWLWIILLKQRKTDKHYPGLGGCSSWQRPEQGRGSQQVRQRKLQHFVLVSSLYYYRLSIFCFSIYLETQKHTTHSFTVSILIYFNFPVWFCFNVAICLLCVNVSIQSFSHKKSLCCVSTKQQGKLDVWCTQWPIIDALQYFWVAKTLKSIRKTKVASVQTTLLIEAHSL